MSWIDIYAIVAGALTGGCVSAVYFVGLALSVRKALYARRPTMVLLVSALVRIALLLGVGMYLLKTSKTAFASYCLTFLVTRLIAVGAARLRMTARQKDGLRQWN